MHAYIPTNYVPASRAYFMLPIPDSRLPAYKLVIYPPTVVAIGLINHNVTYLLSSEIPALRNGHFRPMPFRAGSPTKSIEQQAQVDIPISSGLRSRSNSHVSASGIIAAGQRLQINIKEEQDT